MPVDTEMIGPVFGPAPTPGIRVVTGGAQVGVNVRRMVGDSKTLSDLTRRLSKNKKKQKQ